MLLSHPDIIPFQLKHLCVVNGQTDSPTNNLCENLVTCVRTPLLMTERETTPVSACVLKEFKGIPSFFTMSNIIFSSHMAIRYR